MFFCVGFAISVCATQAEQPSPSPTIPSHYCEHLLGYAKSIYNSPNASKILGYTSRGLVEYFRLMGEFKLGVEDAYTGLRLIHNKYKSCELVNDHVVDDLLESIATRFGRFFSDEQQPSYSFESLQQGMEKLMLSHFTNFFDLFQKDPGTFVARMSGELSTYAEGVVGKSREFALADFENQKDLRNMIVRCFETVISKTVWDQTAHEGIWNSFMSIANGIYKLATSHVLGHMDDLDDLYMSLTHRFCWYLDFTAGFFPVAFYEEIEDDITKKVAFFLEFKEQDEGIRSKKEILLEAVVKAKAKAVAIEKGLFLERPELKPSILLDADSLSLAHGTAVRKGESGSLPQKSVHELARLDTPSHIVANKHSGGGKKLAEAIRTSAPSQVA
jgi:hypothetical protein